MTSKRLNDDTGLFINDATLIFGLRYRGVPASQKTDGPVFLTDFGQFHGDRVYVAAWWNPTDEMLNVATVSPGTYEDRSSASRSSYGAPRIEGKGLTLTEALDQFAEQYHENIVELANERELRPSPSEWRASKWGECFRMVGLCEVAKVGRDNAWQVLDPTNRNPLKEGRAASQMAAQEAADAALVAEGWVLPSPTPGAAQ